MEDPGWRPAVRLEPVYRDEAGGASAAAAVAQLVERERVVALVGPLLSATAEAVLAVAERHSLAVITPTAASGSLGEGSPVFFRTCMTMEWFIGASLAGFAGDATGPAGGGILTRPSLELFSCCLFPAAFRRGDQGARRQRDVRARVCARAARSRPLGRDAGRRICSPRGSGGAQGWTVDALFLAGSATG